MYVFLCWQCKAVCKLRTWNWLPMACYWISIFSTKGLFVWPSLCWPSAKEWSNFQSDWMTTEWRGQKGLSIFPNIAHLDNEELETNDSSTNWIATVTLGVMQLVKFRVYRTKESRFGKMNACCRQPELAQLEGMNVYESAGWKLNHRYYIFVFTFYSLLNQINLISI